MVGGSGAVRDPRRTVPGGRRREVNMREIINAIRYVEATSTGRVLVSSKRKPRSDPCVLPVRWCSFGLNCRRAP